MSYNAEKEYYDLFVLVKECTSKVRIISYTAKRGVLHIENDKNSEYFPTIIHCCRHLMTVFEEVCIKTEVLNIPHIMSRSIWKTVFEESNNELVLINSKIDYIEQIKNSMVDLYEAIQRIVNSMLWWIDFKFCWAHAPIERKLKNQLIQKIVENGLQYIFTAPKGEAKEVAQQALHLEFPSQYPIENIPALDIWGKQYAILQKKYSKTCESINNALDLFNVSILLYKKWEDTQAIESRKIAQALESEPSSSQHVAPTPSKAKKKKPKFRPFVTPTVPAMMIQAAETLEPIEESNVYDKLEIASTALQEKKYETAIRLYNIITASSMNEKYHAYLGLCDAYILWAKNMTDNFFELSSKRQWQAALKLPHSIASHYQAAFRSLKDSKKVILHTNVDEINEAFDMTKEYLENNISHFFKKSTKLIEQHIVFVEQAKKEGWWKKPGKKMHEATPSSQTYHALVEAINALPKVHVETPIQIPALTWSMSAPIHSSPILLNTTPSLRPIKITSDIIHQLLNDLMNILNQPFTAFVHGGKALETILMRKGYSEDLDILILPENSSQIIDIQISAISASSMFFDCLNKFDDGSATILKLNHKMTDLKVDICIEKNFSTADFFSKACWTPYTTLVPITSINPTNVKIIIPAIAINSFQYNTIDVLVRQGNNLTLEMNPDNIANNLLSDRNKSFRLAKLMVNYKNLKPSLVLAEAIKIHLQSERKGDERFSFQNKIFKS